MFVGHYAVALAAKPFAPRASLGTFFMAAQFLDLLWPTLLLLGIEEVRIEPGVTRMTPLNFVSYPYSHSLVMVITWAVGFALIYAWFRRYMREAIVLGIVVVSHWLLDAVAHRPDLPLYPGGETAIGLGLWYSIPGTLAAELSLFIIGVMMYVRTSRAIDAVGRWAMWALIAVLMAIYLVSLFGDAPPSVAAIAWAGEALWLFVLWGYWIDRHRVLLRV